MGVEGDSLGMLMRPAYRNGSPGSSRIKECGGALRLLEEFPDSDPVFFDEPERLPDGWQANHMVLQHLADYRVS